MSYQELLCTTQYLQPLVLITFLITFLHRNPDNICTFSKNPNPVLDRPNNGGGDDEYEVVTIDTTTPHVPPSIPPPPQPTDGDVVYEQIH